jgi:hypothetical protein
MEEPTPTSFSRQTVAAEVIYIAIADKVRNDSHRLAKPIPVEALGALFPDMKPDEIVGHLAALVKIEKYADIKVMTSASGAAYLYSDTSIAPEDAGKQIFTEEVQALIADKVRQVSKERAQLTVVSSLVDLAPNLEPSQIEEFVAAMPGDERYQDIQQVTAPTGTAYLYSEEHMTRNYAVLLARVESKDLCVTIAETVREESRIYPRPTKVRLFYSPVFQIDPGQMEMVVERTLQRQELADIKKIVAATGAVYLFSDKYMDPGLAEAQVQWEEVDKYRNP